MKKFLLLMLLCFLPLYGLSGQSFQDTTITSDAVGIVKQDTLNINDVNSPPEQNKDTVEEDSVKSGEVTKVDVGRRIINIVIYVVLALSLFLNIILILKFKSAYNRKKNKSHGKNEDKVFIELNKVNLDLEKENTLLKNTIASLNMENNKLREMKISKEGENILIQKENFIEDEKSKTIELEVKNEINSANIIFLPSPFEECRFSVEDSSETKKQESIYKIEYNPKNNRGNIKLIETADLSRALNSPNAYLETVCEYQNAFSTNAKGINVVSNGEVVLEDKDWVVTKKIKIKFI